jgi:hypothetical protein
MKSPLGRVAFKSSAIPRFESYEEVAAEYYDSKLHPTCADFRSASKFFLEAFFLGNRPAGRIADIGCGLSLLNDFVSEDLVLVDSSAQMLDRNDGGAEKRLLNLEKQSFGRSEFDWIFAILADPFNSRAAWKNICSALKDKGRCVFIVPSYYWASEFRSRVWEERSGFARFERADGSSVFLPSIVLPQIDQVRLIEAVGMRVISFSHVLVGDLLEVTSPKILGIVAKDQPILDIYCSEKR